jgi:hypothetical protein
MGTGQSSIQRIIPLIALLAVVPIGSCSDDNMLPPGPTTYRPSYKKLSADGPRDNVLYNLQLAYNDRNISRYDELLDDNFVFFFSEEDVLNGCPSYWSRAAEINANKNMFDPNYSNPVQYPVQDLDLMLTYPEGDDQWTPIEPEDQVTYPGETWYQKIVTYSIVVQLTGDFQYVGLNKQAAFVLRAATTDSKQYWRIVVWRDDTGPGLRTVVRHEKGAGIAQDTTWGQIKALYSE